MRSERPSNEEGLFRRTGWVFATGAVGALIMLSGLCALTPGGESLVDRMRDQLRISDSMRLPFYTPTAGSSLTGPTAIPSAPPSASGSGPSSGSSSDPDTTVTQAQTPVATPTPTKAASPTARPTLTQTKPPTDRPTATADAKPTATPDAKATATPDVIRTVIATPVPTADIGTLVPTGIVETLVPTVNVPACVCVGVDLVCVDGATRYNVAECGGSGQCECRGTSLFCPNGSVKALSPDCLP